MSKMLRGAALALVLTALALPVVAEEKTPAAGGDPVVAKVNGETVLRSEVVRELQAMGSQAAQIPPQMIYPQLLEKAIVTKLVSAKGYAEKIQNDKEVKDRLKDAEHPELFSGLVWSGEQAVQLGLVDGLGSASYVAREVIGEEDLVDFTVHESPFDRFAKKIGTSVAERLALWMGFQGPVLR